MKRTWMVWQEDVNSVIFHKEREKYLLQLCTKYGDKAKKQYLEAEEKQKGCCEICKRKMFLVADHKPGTKQFRGLLCAWCNSILGNIERMPHVLNNITNYLGGIQ